MYIVKYCSFVISAMLLLAGLLTACNIEQIPPTSVSDSQTIDVPETPPSFPLLILDDEALLIPVPDFLNKEQQLLYRQADMLYRLMFGGEIGLDFYKPSEQIELEDIYGIQTYQTYESQGKYQNWDDFIKGNPPKTGNFIFEPRDSQNLTIHYREDATGWEDKFYNIPTEIYE